jgi:hypothetical protein
MNAIQKAAFAASAAVITLVGAALATAPMAFAHPQSAVAHGACTTHSLQLTLAEHVQCVDADRNSGLIALNGR